MKWNHLPEAGGIYDQHPTLIDHFMILMDLEAKEEKARQDRQKRQQEAQGRKAKARRGRR